MSKRWTNDEIEYLQENLGNMSINYIAKKMNRTVSSIMNKATRTKIRGATIKTEYLLPNIAAKMVGVDFNMIMYWIKYKGLRYIEKNIAGKKSRILIEYDTFLKFLKDNPKLYDSRKIEPYALGCETQWLIQKRKYDKMQPRLSQQKWTKLAEIEAKRMRQEGYKIQEIADKFERSYASVKRKLYDLRKLEELKNE